MVLDLIYAFLRLGIVFYDYLQFRFTTSFASYAAVTVDLHFPPRATKSGASSAMGSNRWDALKWVYVGGGRRVHWLTLHARVLTSTEGWTYWSYITKLRWIWVCALYKTLCMLLAARLLLLRQRASSCCRSVAVVPHPRELRRSSSVGVPSIAGEWCDTWRSETLSLFLFSAIFKYDNRIRRNHLW